VFTKRNIFLAVYGITLFGLLMTSFLLGTPARFIANADAPVEPKPVYYEEPLFFPVGGITLISGFVPADSTTMVGKICLVIPNNQTLFLPC
jgi:hypothetical protein